ncbi:TraB/GumN family protein [Pontivivens insulae]|uniref:TraB/GumN family protein n=1 Tax=Pontivivens insulae TaxID=1639689 RepID=A0A2R8A6F0_9RHOB|nr:TraB/GumN family protein [Pontivivens insulae]RED17928.1 uncharacterized protein YbaP (TraB family) [Pontivivens insulae]SPF27817.1 hypothetical protein POI8812_00112 [Pontivivens insulae]
MIAKSATLLLSLIFTTAIVGQASARCGGQNLMDTLTEQERGYIDAFVAETAYSTGRAFVARRSTQHIFFYGIIDSGFGPDLPEAVRDGMKGAESMMFRTSSIDEAIFENQLAGDPSLYADTSGESLEKDLSEEQWAILTERLDPLGWSTADIESLHPWVVADWAAFPLCELEGQMNGAQTMEMMVEDTSSTMRMPRSALEAPVDYFNAMNALSRDQQVDLLRWSLSVGGIDGVADLHRTVIALYGEGRTGAMWAIRDVIAGRNPPDNLATEDARHVSYQALIIDRHQEWLGPILFFSGMHPIFVAVGTDHLIGEDGLLRLLEKDGFSIERVMLDGEVE